MNYLITDKLFPFHRDGGTCFTAYEVASYLNTSLNIPTQVVLHLKEKKLAHDTVDFDVSLKPRFPLNLHFFRKFKNDDTILLNSAFKGLDILYFFV